MILDDEIEYSIRIRARFNKASLRCDSIMIARSSKHLRTGVQILYFQSLIVRVVVQFISHHICIRLKELFQYVIRRSTRYKRIRGQTYRRAWTQDSNRNIRSYYQYTREDEEMRNDSRRRFQKKLDTSKDSPNDEDKYMLQWDIRIRIYGSICLKVQCKWKRRETSTKTDTTIDRFDIFEFWYRYLDFYIILRNLRKYDLRDKIWNVVIPEERREF